MSGSVRPVALLVAMAGLALAQTARFPGAVATDQDLLTAIDNAFSQLAAPVPDTTTLTISVNSGASFAGKTNFSVTIEGEQLLICSVTGNTLNVCPGGRGFASTMAAAHPAGVAVRGNNTAWHHNAQSAEIKAVESALGANLANVEKPLTFSSPLSRSSNAITCPLCVVTSGSYSDPGWLTISKAKVGLGAVENTALSTWPGSTSLTTLGTLPSLTTANTPGNGQYTLKNGATDRWKLGLDGAETGANAGSELAFWGYADDGTFLGRWLALSRTGAATFYGGLQWGNDNAWDIGLPSASRPRNLYLANQLVVQGSALIGTTSDDGSGAKLQVGGSAVLYGASRAQSVASSPLSSTFMLRTPTGNETGQYGPMLGFGTETEAAVAKAGIAFVRTGPYGTGALHFLVDNTQDLSQVDLADSKMSISPDGDVSIPKRHQQISFTLADPNVAIPANATPVWVWRAEYSAATATQVWCFSDTGDAVIMLQHSNGPADILAVNLSCGASGSTTSSFSAATIPHLYALGYKVISGTAKQIMVSVKYTGN